jgi:hypothetical protein
VNKPGKIYPQDEVSFIHDEKMIMGEVKWVGRKWCKVRVQNSEDEVIMKLSDLNKWSKSHK